MLLSSSQLPLHGKRILVTAPRSYAARLVQQLIDKGALPIVMPTIETCSLENFTELDLILRTIDTYDWIAFTSRNGIDGLLQRLQDLALPISVLGKSQLAAIGQDAQKLTQQGIKVDLIPVEPSPQGIIKQLALIPGIVSKKIVVPIPEVIGIPEPDVIPKFVQGLEELAMKVICVPTYTTRCLSKILYELELGLIKQGKIDVIALSSTGETLSLLQMLDDKSYCEQCAVACFGPYTAANAKKLGLNISIVAKDYSSFAGFADAIASFFMHHNCD